MPCAQPGRVVNCLPDAWTGLPSLEALPDDAVLEMGHAVGLAEPGLFQLHSLQ